MTVPVRSISSSSSSNDSFHHDDEHSLTMNPYCGVDSEVPSSSMILDAHSEWRVSVRAIRDDREYVPPLLSRCEFIFIGTVILTGILSTTFFALLYRPPSVIYPSLAPTNDANDPSLNADRNNVSLAVDPYKPLTFTQIWKDIGLQEAPTLGSIQYRAVTWLRDKDCQQLVRSKNLVQRYALICLGYATNPEPAWASCYTTRTNECVWPGVDCDDHDVVTGIEIDQSLNYVLGIWQGTLPTEIGLLSYLTSLVIQDHPLVGDLPSTLASLPRLSVLSVPRTNLAPTRETIESLQHLAYLDLSYTLTNGPFAVPKSLALRQYSVAHTNILGTVPFEYVDLLKQLDKLDLRGSMLEGTLPMELCVIDYLRLDCWQLRCACCKQCSNHSSI